MADTFDTILKSTYLTDQRLINVVNTLLNRCFGAAGLDIDEANTENVETNNAIDYCINGIVYQLAATAEIDLSALAVYDADGDLAAAVAVADDYECLFVLAVNAAGTIIVCQADQVALGEDSKYPVIPAGYAAFGAVLVVNESAATFTFGTTDLDTVGITDTYYDLSVCLPGQEF